MDITATRFIHTETSPPGAGTSARGVGCDPAHRFHGAQVLERDLDGHPQRLQQLDAGLDHPGLVEAFDSHRDQRLLAFQPVRGLAHVAPRQFKIGFGWPRAFV